MLVGIRPLTCSSSLTVQELLPKSNSDWRGNDGVVGRCDGSARISIDDWESGAAAFVSYLIWNDFPRVVYVTVCLVGQLVKNIVVEGFFFCDPRAISS